MNTNIARAFALSSVSILALTLSPAASAQSSGEDNEEPQVEEIIVTATKQERTLQQVPVAVSVVGGEVLENAQIVDILDLQSVIPSLQVGQRLQSGQTNFFIRGFGNGSGNLGIEPSVGVFIDGVYRSRSSGAISDLNAIERVEVLKGPQSTLFGKNSSVGVISVVTAKPEFDYNGKIEGTYGNFNQAILRGYFTGPLTDTLAFSVEGSYNRRDGFAENINTGGDLDDRERWAVRGQLLFEPQENLSLRLVLDRDELDEACCYTSPIIDGATAPAIAALSGVASDFDVFNFETNETFDPTNKIENQGISLEANWETDLFTLTSITAFRELKTFENNDADFSRADTLGERSQDYDIETFTQEVRLSGSVDRFSWLAGAFYTSEDLVTSPTISYGSQTRAFSNLLSNGALSSTEILLQNLGVVPPGTMFQAASNSSTQTATQDNESISLFAETEFEVTDRLRITAGISYIHDEKDVSLSEDFNFPFSSLNLVEIGQGLITQQGIAQGFAQATGGTIPPTPANIAAFAAANPAAFAQIQGGAQAFAAANATNPQVNQLLGLAQLQFFTPNVALPNAVETGASSDNDVNYNIRVAYDLTDEINLFGGYSTGFKATSWNLTRDSRPFAADLQALAAAGLLPNVTAVSLGRYAGTRFAGPEESEVWEFGLKSRFEIGRFNLTLFEQTIENFQNNVFTGIGFALQNAGQQSTRGIEAELYLSPTDWLDFSFSGTYLDAKFDEFVGAQGVGGPQDLSGVRVAGIPEFASSTSFTLKQTFGNVQTFFRMDWQYESPTQITINVPANIEREVSLFNASVGINLENGFEFLLWGRNIFKDQHFTFAFPTAGQPGSFRARPNNPRTYGITVRKRF